MAPRRAKVNKFDYTKLTANDVLCPVCRSILIEPITLPCNHGFCASCFGPSTQNANVVCPSCRVRVGSWLRSATKSKKLINQSFWQAIKELFPRQVENKLNGVDENFINDKIKQINNVPIPDKLISSKIQSPIQLSKNNNKIESLEAVVVPSTSTCTTNSANIFTNRLVKNFATKEYTCRILCQNVPKKPSQVPNAFPELIQKKHKRIQKITESELLNTSRSNSIESECLYFRPIDYRHNPPSAGLAPIKVPTRKPNFSSQIKILAPCGQNQINISSLNSAFARLLPILQESGVKRKCQKPVENVTAKKRLRSYRKTSSEDDVLKPDENLRSHNVKKAANVMKQISESLHEQDRTLQEKADYELAKKLQEKYNQYAQYSTRSRVIKKGQQRQLGGLMTQVK